MNSIQVFGHLIQYNVLSKGQAPRGVIPSAGPRSEERRESWKDLALVLKPGAYLTTFLDRHLDRDDAYDPA